jgi:hypothetical protein
MVYSYTLKMEAIRSFETSGSLLYSSIECVLVQGRRKKSSSARVELMSSIRLQISSHLLLGLPELHLPKSCFGAFCDGAPCRRVNLSKVKTYEAARTGGTVAV